MNGFTPARRENNTLFSGVRLPAAKRQSAALPTEAARLISEQVGDEKDVRSEAVMALVQSELFETIVNLQEATDADDPSEGVGLLSSAAKNIATLTRASIALKRHQRQVTEAVAAKLAEMESKARAGSGLDAETLRRVREEIYGITENPQ